MTRATKNRPPAHLCDLGTADFMETFGRERRHRYYTLTAYKTLMASENLEDTTEIDLSKVGDFAAFNDGMFYVDDDALHHYQDTYMDKEGAKSKKSAKKRKRGESDDLGGAEAVEGVPELTPKAKRGRPRKKPLIEDSGDEPTPKKRGRPRKQPPVEDGGDTPTRPERLDRPPMIPIPEPDGTAATSVVPKRRGRAPKQKSNNRADLAEAGVAAGESLEGVVSSLPLPPALPSSPETRENPPESQHMTVAAPVQLGSSSATPPTAPEPPTSSPKEVVPSVQKSSASELASSAVHESPNDDQRHIIHTEAVSGEETAVQTSSHGTAVTPLVGELVRSQSGLVDAHSEDHRGPHREPNSDVQDDGSRLTCQAPGTEIERLPCESSTDHTNAAEATGLPRTNPPAQEPIIDPALLTPSSVSNTMFNFASLVQYDSWWSRT